MSLFISSRDVLERRATFIWGVEGNEKSRLCSGHIYVFLDLKPMEASLKNQMTTLCRYLNAFTMRISDTRSR